MPDTLYERLRRTGQLPGTGVPGGYQDPLATPDPTTFQRILDLLNRPANAAASGALALAEHRPVLQSAWEGFTGDQHHSFEDVLSQQGMAKGIPRTLLGLGLDIGLDPTNLIPGSLIAKGIGKVAPLEKGYAAFQKGLGKATDAMAEHGGALGRALDRGLNEITPGRSLRHTTAPGESAADALYPKVASIRRMEEHAASSAAKLDATDRFRDKYLAVRQALGKKETLGESMDRVADYLELGPVEAANRGLSLHPTELALAKEWQDFAAARGSKEVAEGVLPEEHIRPHYLFRRFLNEERLKAVDPAGIIGDPRFTKARKIQEPLTRQVAENLGITRDTNLISLAASRQFMGDRAIIYKNFIHELTRPSLANDPNLLAHLRVPKMIESGRMVEGPGGRLIPEMIENPEMEVAIRNGFKDVNLPGHLHNESAFGVKDYAFHPEVARDLSDMFKVRPAPGAVASVIDTLHNLWKPLATVIRPAFTLRNIGSNMYMSIPAGMHPAQMLERYAEASKILLPEAMKTALGKAYRGDPHRYAADVRNILGKRFGVTGVSYGGGAEIGEAADESLTRILSPVRNIQQHLGPVAVGRNVASLSENISRMALFIDQLEKRGWTAERLQQRVAPFLNKTAFLMADPAQKQAFKAGISAAQESAIHTNHWLLNYADKTHTEHAVLSRMIPFYVWARRIVPLLVETAATHPQLLSAQGKIKTALEKRVDPETLMAEGRRPDWMQENNVIQLPSSTLGERFFADPGLPGQDLNIVPAPGGTSLMKAAQQGMSRLSPLKLLAEIPMNKSLSNMQDLWQNQPGELTRASGTMNVLARLPIIGPEIATALGMVKKGETWYAPAGADYAASQILPPVETFGKGLRGPLPGQLGDANEAKRIQRNFATYPSIQRDTAAQELHRRQGAKRIYRSEQETALQQLIFQMMQQGGR